MPLDKQNNIAGQMSAGHHYVPPDGGEPVPSLGSWPLLYHLGRDPGEAYNVVAREPEVAARLKERLDSWRADFYANPRGWR